MESLDGKRIVNNIYSKAKELDIKIGDIEKDVPVSLGYFSRFLKDDNHSLPSLESLYVASQKLNVTLDFLLFSNYSDMNEEELLLQRKIAIMLLKTEQDVYCWNEITAKEFNKFIYPSDYNSSYVWHPFVKLKEQTDFVGQLEYYKQHYFSFFLEEEFIIEDSIFFLKIENNTFYLAKIVDDENNIVYYEMYVYINDDSSDTLYKLVNACNMDKFYELLEELYSLCNLKSQSFKLDVSAKNALDSIK